MPHADSQAAGISGPRDAASFATSELAFTWLLDTGHSPVGLMERCPSPLSRLCAHREVEAEALGYLLACHSLLGV